MINLAQKVGQKFVNAVFKDVHTNYDKANDAMSLFLHRKWKRDFIKMLDISANDNVLDLASGTGDIANLLLQKTQNVTLCDINQQMLDVAKSKVSGGTFVLADAKNLPFESNSFDCITCVFGARNFQELEQSIEECHRVLKQGGTLAIMEFMPSSCTPLHNRVYRAYIKYVLPKYDSLFKNSSQSYTYLSQSILNFQTRCGMSTILKQAGFRVVTPSLMNGAVGVFSCIKK